MEQLSTSLILDYLSNNVKNTFKDIKVFEHNTIDILSKMICKALEDTNFVKDGSHYTLDVHQESDTVLYFKVTKYV